MSARVTHIAVENAIQDIKSRTLAPLRDDFGRLICLASTRDYNTGRYYHEGLASSFSDEVAAEALAACHRETFDQLALRSLEGLVEELQTYIVSTLTSPAEVIKAWERLEPYRVTIPLDCDPLSAEIFFSDIKIGLAILRSRPGNGLQDPQSS